MASAGHRRAERRGPARARPACWWRRCADGARGARRAAGGARAAMAGARVRARRPGRLPGLCRSCSSRRPRPVLAPAGRVRLDLLHAARRPPRPRRDRAAARPVAARPAPARPDAVPAHRRVRRSPSTGTSSASRGPDRDRDPSSPRHCEPGPRSAPDCRAAVVRLLGPAAGLGCAARRRLRLHQATCERGTSSRGIGLHPWEAVVAVAAGLLRRVRAWAGAICAARGDEGAARSTTRSAGCGSSRPSASSSAAIFVTLIVFTAVGALALTRVPQREPPRRPRGARGRSSSSVASNGLAAGGHERRPAGARRAPPSAEPSSTRRTAPVPRHRRRGQVRPPGARRRREHGAGSARRCAASAPRRPTST